MQLISKAFCQPAVEGEGREKPLVKNIFNIQGGLFYRRKKKKKEPGTCFLHPKSIKGD